MQRKITMLFSTALVTSTGLASADVLPKPAPIQPQTLATGAPACGNVMMKYGAPPVCPSYRVIAQIAELARDLEQIRGPVEHALTVAFVPRPHS